MRNGYIIVTAINLLMGCSTKENSTTGLDRASPAIGADQTEHGCKGSAGYQWSAVQKKCVRLFETRLRMEPQSAPKGADAYVLFATPDDDVQAEVFLPGDKTGRLMAKIPNEGAGTWRLDTLTLNQWKGMYRLTGVNGKVLYEGHVMTEVNEKKMVYNHVPNVKAILQGSWQSVTDPNDEFTIKGQKIIRTYAHQKRLVLSFEYVSDCRGNGCTNQKSRYGCFITAGEFDIDCQTIVNISDRELEVSEGGLGKTIRYRKKQ